MTVALILPVKHLTQAKSRLALPPQERRRTALRLLRHTLAVATSTSAISTVIVVTDDEVVIGESRAQGALVVSEHGGQGLVRAATIGRRASRQFPQHDAVGVMVGDLPQVATADLIEVFAEYEVHGRPMFVADRAGTGTTMIIHPRHSSPPILFGPDSAYRHRTAGYRAATRAVPGLRADLDTVEDLERMIPVER